ncbi:MAG: hypothetical protein IPO75_19360 [Betaproteobacteria bacterium]|nr:hypothetical protein [Betaproteobacteria bacterium]
MAVTPERSPRRSTLPLPTLWLAGLLLAAWVIAGFLVFKIWPDGIHPLEVAITRPPWPWTASVAYRSSGVKVSRGRTVSITLFVASAIDRSSPPIPQGWRP